MMYPLSTQQHAHLCNGRNPRPARRHCPHICSPQLRMLRAKVDPTWGVAASASPTEFKIDDR